MSQQRGGSLTPASTSPRTGARTAVPRPERERTAWWQSFLEAGPVDVSVCIANWNCRELLRRCLESIHDVPQGVRLETIVVDNGSSDDAADMVARDFPEVYLIRNERNLGFARANNQAVQHARGRFLCFLNNDTVLPPFALRRLCEYAEANPHVGMIGPLLRGGEGRVQASCRLRPTLAVFLHHTSLLRWTGLFRHAYRRYRRQICTPPKPRAVEVLMGAALFVPHAVFRACGRWDEDFFFGGEDLELCFRIGKHYPLVFYPQVEVTHLGRASTRQQIGFASTQIAIGFVRYLRKTGCAPLALGAYKFLITLDAPLQYFAKGLQYLWRRARRRHAKAEKSLRVVHSLAHFMRHGLIPFWKA